MKHSNQPKRVLVDLQALRPDPRVEQLRSSVAENVRAILRRQPGCSKHQVELRSLSAAMSHAALFNKRFGPSIAVLSRKIQKFAASLPKIDVSRLSGAAGPSRRFQLPQALEARPNASRKKRKGGNNK